MGEITIKTTKLAALPRSKALRARYGGGLSGARSNAGASGAYLTLEEFMTYFRKTDTDAGSTLIEAQLPLYSLGDITAFGPANASGGTSVTGGISAAALEAYLKEKAYATQTWVLGQGFITSAALGAYITEKDADARYQPRGSYLTASALTNYVTLNSAQTVTGAKTFAATLTAATSAGVKGMELLALPDYGALRLYNTASGGYVSLLQMTDKTLLVNHRDASGNVGDASLDVGKVLTKSVTIGGSVSLTQSGGHLAVDRAVVANGDVVAFGPAEASGGTSVTGGISAAALEAYLKEKAYATQTWVLGQGFITSAALGAYITETDADARYQPKGSYLTAHQSLTHLVTLATAQTISGAKVFTAGQTIRVDGSALTVRSASDANNSRVALVSEADGGEVYIYGKGGNYVSFKPSATAEELSLARCYDGKEFGKVKLSVPTLAVTNGSVTVQGDTSAFVGKATDGTNRVVLEAYDTRGGIRLYGTTGDFASIATNADASAVVFKQYAGGQYVENVGVQAAWLTAVNGPVKIGSVSLTQSGGHLAVDKAVVANGDVVAFGPAETSGGTSASGGISAAALEAYLKEKAYATQTWVLGQGFITSAALGAYITETDADARYQPKGNYLTAHQSLTHLVTLATAQTISGAKVFTAGQTIRVDGSALTVRSASDANNSRVALVSEADGGEVYIYGKGGNYVSFKPSATAEELSLARCYDGKEFGKVKLSVPTLAVTNGSVTVQGDTSAFVGKATDGTNRVVLEAYDTRGGIRLYGTTGDFASIATNADASAVVFKQYAGGQYVENVGVQAAWLTAMNGPVTAPSFKATTTATCTNLNADLLDGKHLADILNSNVASATKLQTARTLWGQSFNGTGNVSGSLSGVGSISASGSFRTTDSTVAAGYHGSIESANLRSALFAYENYGGLFLYYKGGDRVALYPGASATGLYLRQVDAAGSWNDVVELNVHDIALRGSVWLDSARTVRLWYDPAAKVIRSSHPIVADGDITAFNS